MKTSKVVTVATGAKSSAKGKLAKVPVLFDNLEAEIDFIIMENIPFSFIVGRSTLKRLGGVLDYKAEKVSMDYHGQDSIFPILSEYSQPLDLVGRTDSEDFTSGSDSEDALSNEGK